MSLQYTRVAFGGVVLTVALGFGPAYAADAKQIADSIIATMNASGESQATYADATASGDDVTITDLKVVSDGGSTTVTVPSMVISGAEPREKGGFTADKITVDNGSILSKENTITWKTAAVTDATIPSPEEAKAKAKISPFSELEMSGLSVSGPEMPAAVNIASTSVSIDMDDAGVPKEFELSIDDIVLPPELFASEPQTKQVLDALGYSGFTVSVDVSGGYESSNDTLTLKNFIIDTDDVGKLDIAGQFSGVPLTKLATSGGDDPSAMADAKLDKLTIRFDNAGVVEKALDMQAKMMGVSRDDFVAQISGALPLMLTAVGNQPFQDKVTAAATAFLKDPKSISISLAPASPVPFAQIMGIAGEQPQTLPDVLAVDVQANN